MTSPKSDSDWIRPDQPSKCTYDKKERAPSPHTRRTRSYYKKPKIYPDVLSHVHDTPLVRINKITKEDGLKCEFYVKCEFLSPGGSVKDRIAIRMIEEAEAANIIKPGDTLIEPTSGNTGIGIALAALVKGYKCTIVMPEKMSKEKIDTLRGMNADIVRTPTGASFTQKESHIRTAATLSKKNPHSHILDQYRNAANPMAHYDITAEEIYEACSGKVDMFVCGAGTGGTIAGIGRKLKEKLPNVLIVGADPYGSILACPEELNKTSITFYEIEGIGGDFIPTTLDRAVVDKWVKCTDKDAFTMARRLIKQEGLLCGGSSGAAMHCAVQAAKEYNLGGGSRVVVLLPDNIRNYMSKFLLDDWMNARGFLEEPKEKDHDQKYWWRNKELSVLRLHAAKKMSIDSKLGDAAKRFKQHEIIAAFQNQDKKIVGTLTARTAMTSIAGGKKGVKIKDVIDRNFRSLLITDTLGKLESYFENDSHVLIFKIDPKTNLKQLLGYLAHMDLAHYICHNKP